MKLKLTTIIITALAIPFAYAEDKHDHHKDQKSGTEHADHEEDNKAKKGPNGGHIVKSQAGFAFEVTVDKERKARIVILDKDNKAVAPAEQSITGIAGERSAPVKIAFAKGKDADANVLISDKALPAGEHVSILLVIKTTPDAKAVTERFELHLH